MCPTGRPPAHPDIHNALALSICNTASQLYPPPAHLVFSLFTSEKYPRSYFINRFKTILVGKKKCRPLSLVKCAVVQNGSRRRDPARLHHGAVDAPTAVGQARLPHKEPPDTITGKPLSKIGYDSSLRKRAPVINCIRP